MFLVGVTPVSRSALHAGSETILLGRRDAKRCLRSGGCRCLLAQRVSGELSRNSARALCIYACLSVKAPVPDTVAYAQIGGICTTSLSIKVWGNVEHLFIFPSHSLFEAA